MMILNAPTMSAPLHPGFVAGFAFRFCSTSSVPIIISVRGDVAAAPLRYGHISRPSTPGRPGCESVGSPPARVKKVGNQSAQ